MTKLIERAGEVGRVDATKRIERMSKDKKMTRIFWRLQADTSDYQIEHSLVKAIPDLSKEGACDEATFEAMVAEYKRVHLATIESLIGPCPE